MIWIFSILGHRAASLDIAWHHWPYNINITKYRFYMAARIDKIVISELAATDLPAFYWRDRYFHYWPLLTTDGLSMKGNGNVFPFPDSLMTTIDSRGKGNGNGICFRFGNGIVFPFPRGNGKWKHVSVSRNGFPFPWCHLIYGTAPY